MARPVHTSVRAAAFAVLLMAAGCASMAGWENVLGMPGSGGQLRGEVDRIDSRRREIRLVSGWGRSTTVSYDARTEVVGARRRSVSGLSRGDEVSMRVMRDRAGHLYTDRIYLERDGRDRSRRDDGRRRTLSRSLR